MPDIAYTVEQIRGADRVVVTWSDMMNGNSGVPYDISNYIYKSIHLYGTFDTGQAIVYGSNEVNNPVNWVQVVSPMTVAGLYPVGSISNFNTVWIRPVVGGTYITTLMIKLFLQT